MTRWGRICNLTLWFFQCFAAFAFLYFGAGKFNPRAIFWAELFAKIGFGQWFRYFTGGLEVVCAVLLLIPKTSAVAALLLACTMIGAILTHVFVLREPAVVIIFPSSLLLIMIVVLWYRRPTAAASN
jgi:putative oxidoreductase